MTSGQETPAAGKNTHFAFAHKVFALGGCQFASEHNGQACFMLPMGEGLGSIAFPALRQEFAIEEESADGKMLETVAAGLKFVKVIRPGDSIPSELLDGSASWSVDKVHFDTALNRLLVQLITWLSGSEEIIRDPAQLEQMAKTPETKKQLGVAFKEMAARIGAKGDAEEEILLRVNRLAHELAYIEGLWAYFLQIKEIGSKVEQACRAYSRDAGIKDTLDRVPQLLKPVIEDIELQFDQLEVLSEIVRAMEHCDDHIKVIRGARDELHLVTKIWKDLPGKWQQQPVNKRSEKLERLAQETYQFLALHFPQSQEWELRY